VPRSPCDTPVATAPLLVVRGQAMLSLPRQGVDELRDQPPRGVALPPRFLRHADEQTVVGVHAVAVALAGASGGDDDRKAWAVIAAPRGAGRPAAARTLAGWHAGGHAVVSPHVVPQCSLHAMASAVSVALGCHGTHLGVGGGPEAVAEALLALPWLAAAHPAVILVATGWDREPEIGGDGAGGAETVVRAVAVLVAPSAAACGPTLSLVLDRQPPAREPRSADELDRFARLVAAAPDRVGRVATVASFATRRGGSLRVTIGAIGRQEAA